MGISARGTDHHGELELVLTIDEHAGSCWLSKEMWLAFAEHAGWFKKGRARPKKEETISRGELELAGIPVKLKRFMVLSESVIELAEVGVFGPVFETCEADCDCTICELRVALGRPRGHAD